MKKAIRIGSKWHLTWVHGHIRAITKCKGKTCECQRPTNVEPDAVVTAIYIFEH